jgi:hypothetical protein
MAEQSPRTVPWEALGFEQQDVDASAARAIAVFKGWNPPPNDPAMKPWPSRIRARAIAFVKTAGVPTLPVLVDSWAFNYHLVASPVFAMGALGYTIDHPVLRDWREAGRQVVQAVLYYFFGPWRKISVAGRTDRSQAIAGQA